MTLFEMRAKLAELQQQKNELKDYMIENAGKPDIPLKDLEDKETEVKGLEKRMGILETSIREAEETARKALATKNCNSAMTEEQARIKAKADFYRAALLGSTSDLAKAYEGLGAIPAADPDLGSGDQLLPTTMTKELLLEPMDINPLRAIVHVTNITGLKEPKLGFTIEDADIADITDKDTAKEIELEGDSVAYGRLEMRVSATLKATVLYGTDTDVVSAVERALRSALAKREKYFAFQTAASITTNSDTAHAHMSFYQESDGGTVIKTVEGDTPYAAIVNALADLADDYSANARVVMKKNDYFAMIQTLTNDSEALFGSKPASILGYPVVFCDKAVVPVVGDFSYYGINYDIGSVFETDKDAKAGEYYFVFTAWGDQQIRMKSAFRLAKVAEADSEQQGE